MFFELRYRYTALSRQYLPDFLVRDGHEKLAEVQEISVELDKAYAILQDPVATIRYVLQLKGLLGDEETYILPPDFLAQVLDIHQELIGFDKWDPESQLAGIKSIQASLHKLDTQIYEPVKDIIEDYQEAVSSEEDLLQVKSYYYRKKYLDRIRLELAGKL